MSSRKKRKIASSSDEEEEEEEERGKRSRKQAATSRAAHDWSESDEDEDSDWSAKGKKPKKPTGGRGRGARKAASSSSESESASSSEGEGDSEDDLYENEEERKKFEAMTQVEREMALYERSQQRELQRERKRVLKGLKKKGKLDKHKKEREHKKEKEKEKPPERVAEKRKAIVEWSDSSEDERASQSDEERGRKGRAAGRRSRSRSRSPSPARTPEPQLSLDDINSVRLSRYKLEKWFDQPFFEDTVKGCFIRVNIGQFEGRPVCRIVEIVDVVTSNSRQYTFANKNCTTLLLCRFGSAEKQFQMKYVSNTPFTEQEFATWKEEMTLCDVALPTPQRIAERQKAIADAFNFKYTDQDVERIVREKQKATRNHLTADMVFQQRELLTQELNQARAKDDQDEVETLTRRLEELEALASEQRRQMEQRYNVISKINQRALRANMESAPIVDDPRYVRVPSKPAMLTVSEKRKLDEQVKKEEEEAARKAEEAAAQAAAEQKENEAEMRRRQSVDAANLAQLHDFDIGIVVDLPPPVGATSAPPPSNSTAANGSKPVTLEQRRAMRLSEYKAKKGLI